MLLLGKNAITAYTLSIALLGGCTGEGPNQHSAHRYQHQASNALLNKLDPGHSHIVIPCTQQGHTYILATRPLRADHKAHILLISERGLEALSGLLIENGTAGEHTLNDDSATLVTFIHGRGSQAVASMKIDVFHGYDGFTDKFTAIIKSEAAENKPRRDLEMLLHCLQPT